MLKHRAQYKDTKALSSCCSLRYQNTGLVFVIVRMIDATQSKRRQILLTEYLKHSYLRHCHNKTPNRSHIETLSNGFDITRYFIFRWTVNLVEQSCGENSRVKRTDRSRQTNSNMWTWNTSGNLKFVWICVCRGAIKTLNLETLWTLSAKWKRRNFIKFVWCCWVCFWRSRA